MGAAALSGALVALGNNGGQLGRWMGLGGEPAKTGNEAGPAPAGSVKTTEIRTTTQTTVAPTGERTITETRTEVTREVVVASAGPPPLPSRPPLPPPPAPYLPPPPPPPPAPLPPPCPDCLSPPIPTPCASGPFIVFFDWDRDQITPQAAAILDNAAAAYQACGATRIWIGGHADRSGPADYNIALSQARADGVRAHLAGRGIADDLIATRAFGESRPLVETADGVLEPQNRRVEVTFGPDSGW